MINLLFCGDKRIGDGVAMSVLSILHNNSDTLNIYILTATLKNDEFDISPCDSELEGVLLEMLRLYGNGGAVRIFDISEHFSSELPMANIKTRFTPLCMLRLFADREEGLPDKLLYLDNDVLCRGDISELYNTDISDYEIAGVPDRYGKWLFEGGALTRSYLNSGVLLMNMKKIHETRLLSRARELCVTRKMLMPDQSALNKLAYRKMKLERRYNEQKAEREDTVLRHFTTTFRFFPYFRAVTVKPWDIERVHSVLGTREYDELYQEFFEIKKGILQ